MPHATMLKVSQTEHSDSTKTIRTIYIKTLQDENWFRVFKLHKLNLYSTIKDFGCSSTKFY